MQKGKELLRNLKFYEAYSKYREELGRKETWEESVDDVMSMHYNKFSHIPKMVSLLNEATEDYKTSLILASQRNLQFREAQIHRNNARLYNCCSTYIDRPEVFKQIMFLLLSGCGVGYSVESRFVEALPSIKERNSETITYVIEDSIEGWAMALDVLVNSFFNGSEQIRFDGSRIRPEGAFISGGFKAPGYEPLKKALEKIEALLQSCVGRNLSTLDAHEIICISSDAVLSAGVRRSALIALFDKDDELMLTCKTGDWFYKKPWLARCNNSVKLLRGSFTQEEFNVYKESIKQFGEPGIVLVTDMRFVTNPCAEIGFIPINPRTGRSCISFCNLNEINGGACTTKELFFRACRTAAILGTAQATYTNFEFLGQDTIELVEWEALIGVSITGIMDNPSILLNPKILRDGAEIVKETNAEVAAILGINPAARCCTIKPSGNASVLLGTASGIHASHSKRYFRIMQMNKNSEIGKLLADTNPDLLEEGVWSANNSDYAVYIPVEESKEAITKDTLLDVSFLEIVSLVYENWVMGGHRWERGWSKYVTHNVSNTITVNNWDDTFDYIYHHQNSFCGLSFLASEGDKIYKQAPFTKVLNFDEIVSMYGEGSMFASGLIVDALHAFYNDLWDACEATVNRKFALTGDRVSVLIKKDVVRRIKQFAKNYYRGDIEKTIECLKDVHLFHKWQTINRKFNTINFTEIDLKPTYTDINTTGGIACSGGNCEITRI